MFRTAQALLSGAEALWFWRSNGSLTIMLVENRWRQVLARGTQFNVIFDGTASIHYAYAAVPRDIGMVIHRYSRPRFPNLRFRFDTNSITKGRGTTNVNVQISYVEECLSRLAQQGFRGEVLVVTHKACEPALRERLESSPLAAYFSPADRETDAPASWSVAHFGGMKGSNLFRTCKAVIITHKHNIPADEALALAQCIFEDVHVLHLEKTGHLSEKTLPKQWTPLRRGLTGKNTNKRSLFSQHFGTCYSREVQYVMRSHLATEIVQAVMRSAVRENSHAKVDVFIPLGDDTSLALAILREVPGACCTIP